MAQSSFKLQALLLLICAVIRSSYAYKCLIGMSQGKYVLPKRIADCPIGCVKTASLAFNGTQEVWTHAWDCARSEFSSNAEMSILSPIDNSLNYAASCKCTSDYCSKSPDHMTRKSCYDENVKLTKSCYYAKNSTATIDKDVPLIKCSSTSHCTKFIVSIPGRSEPEYSWGCLGIPQLKCGQREPVTIDNVKMCACCGDKCNGDAMDLFDRNSDTCFNSNIVKNYKSVATISVNSSFLIIFLVMSNL